MPKPWACAWRAIASRKPGGGRGPRSTNGQVVLGVGVRCGGVQRVAAGVVDPLRERLALGRGEDRRGVAEPGARVRRAGPAVRAAAGRAEVARRVIRRPGRGLDVERLVARALVRVPVVRVLRRGLALAAVCGDVRPVTEAGLVARFSMKI